MKSEQFRMTRDAELRHWWFVGRRRILQRLIARLLPPSKDATIVDVGCCTGANAAMLSRHYSCVGVDASQEAVDLARKSFPGVPFYCSQTPEQSKSILSEANLVLLADVLEHIEDDVRFFASLLAQTAPGTYILLTVPADMSLWSPHDESHGHYRRYNRRRLERLWQNLPVTSLLTSHFNSRLYPAIRLIRARNRQGNQAYGEAQTDLRIPSRFLNGFLERVFVGEGRVLEGMLLGNRKRSWQRGVSLMAILRRRAGFEMPGRKTVAPVPDCPALASQKPTRADAVRDGGVISPEDCTIVVPCYNEARRLDVNAYLKFAVQGQDYRFLFVDDGSSDDTADALDTMHALAPERFDVHRLSHNVGKAEAVRAGIGQAVRQGAKIVGFWDSDLATPLDEIPEFFRLLERRPELQIVMGARVRLLGRRIQRRALRHCLGRVFASLASRILRVPVYDTQCGAKLFRVTPETSRLFDLPFRTKWIFDVELLARFLAGEPSKEQDQVDRMVYEYPLRQWRDVGGSKIRLRDFARAAYDLTVIHFAYRLKLKLGRCLAAKDAPWPSQHPAPAMPAIGPEVPDCTGNEPWEPTIGLDEGDVAVPSGTGT